VLVTPARSSPVASSLPVLCLLPGVKTTLSDYFLFTGNTLKKHRSSSNQRSEGLAVICPGPVN